MLRVSLAFTRKKNTDYISYNKSVVLAMTNNVNFVNPEPPLADVSTALTGLENLQLQSESRDKNVLNARDQQRIVVNQLMLQLVAWVFFTATSGSSSDEEIKNKIESAGLQVITGKGEPIGPLPTPLPPLASVTNMPGVIELEWEKIKGSYAYIVQYVPGTDVSPNANWQFLASTNKRKFATAGLASGYYSFRIIALGAAGSSEPSEGVTEWAR